MALQPRSFDFFSVKIISYIDFFQKQTLYKTTMQIQPNIPPMHEIGSPGKNGAPSTRKPFHLQESNSGACEYSWHKENEQGSAHFTMVEIQPGFELWYHNCSFQQDLFISCQNAPPSVSFSFCFSGAPSFHTPYGRNITLPPQSQCLRFYPYDEVSAHVPKDMVCSRLFVFLSPERFLTFFDKDMDSLVPPVRNIAEKGVADFFSHTDPISPVADILLEQFQSCPFHGDTRKRFFEGLALHIMALQLKSLERRFVPSDRRHRVIHPEERKRVERIKEFIDSCLDSPPGLSELAKKAAMSAPRLNQCFRTLYGATIFEYVRQERFHQAKIMLEQGLSVTEASLAVGYESLASFSISFKKRFGYAPSRYFSQK